MDTKGDSAATTGGIFPVPLEKYDGDGEYSGQQEENLLLSMWKSLKGSFWCQLGARVTHTLLFRVH